MSYTRGHRHELDKSRPAPKKLTNWMMAYDDLISVHSMKRFWRKGEANVKWMKPRFLDAVPGQLLFGECVQRLSSERNVITAEMLRSC